MLKRRDCIPDDFPMFSFFKRKPKEPPAAPQEPVLPREASEQPIAASTPVTDPVPPPAAPPPEPVLEALADPAAPAMQADADVDADADVASETEEAILVPAETPPEVKKSWLSRLKAGLSKTSTNLTTLFVGAKIDD